MGEHYFRQGINVNPKIPHCFTVLAQCLYAQKRVNEAVETISNMFKKETPYFDRVEIEEDHRNKLVESLKGLKLALGSSNQQYKTILSNAIQKYPFATKLFQSI